MPVYAYSIHGNFQLFDCDKDELAGISKFQTFSSLFTVQKSPVTLEFLYSEFQQNHCLMSFSVVRVTSSLFTNYCLYLFFCVSIVRRYRMTKSKNKRIFNSCASRFCPIFLNIILTIVQF